MSESDTETETKTPNWLTAPLAHLMNDISSQRDLLYLATRGIAGLQSSPIVAEAASRLRKKQLTADERECILREAKLARDEVANNFPQLHAHAVIALWHSLENHLRQVILAWVTNEKAALNVEAVGKLKIRLRDYLYLEEDERLSYIVDQLEQEIGAPLKMGVGRFEVLLEVFGLGGSVTEVVRRTILELQNIRNVLVHRGGNADRHLLHRCPWLPFRTGDRVKVGHLLYRRFTLAVFVYVMELLIRFAERYNDDAEWCRTYAATELAKLELIDCSESYTSSDAFSGLLLPEEKCRFPES